MKALKKIHEKYTSGYERWTEYDEFENEISRNDTTGYWRKTKYDETNVCKDFNFKVSASVGGELPFKIYSIDNAPVNIFNEHDSVYLEENEGRIGLKLIDINNEIYNGNICIRRTDNRSNFTKWEDIKIMNFIQETVSSSDITAKAQMRCVLKKFTVFFSMMLLSAIPI